MQENNEPDSSISVRRQNIKADKRQSYLDNWKKSGLSMSEFCRQHHLPISTFSSWANKSGAIDKKLFKPLVTSVPSVVNDAEIGVIEIIFKDSVKIRFLKSSNLSLILKVAKELTGCS